MEKYEKYKDSGIEWIGEIPSHWEVVPIKYSLSIPLTDGPHETPELIPDGIPFISAEAIKNDKIDFNKKRGFISIEEHERFSLKYKPQIGDVYMIKSGATTGNLARVQTNDEFNIWSPLAAFRPAPKKTTTDFLFFYMRSSRFFSAIELGWNYGTQQNIGMNVLENLRMVRPTIKEQTAIAHYLDRKTAEIDELIVDKKSMLELYEEEKTAIINEMVTGKKVWNGNAWAEPVEVKDSGIEWLGEIPEGWEVRKANSLISVKRGAGYQYITEVFGDEEFEYVLRISDFNYYDPIRGLKTEELGKYRVTTGEILIAGTGASAGITIYVDERMNGLVHSYNALRIAVTKSLLLNSKYLFFLFQSYMLNEQMSLAFTGSAQHFLDVGRITSFIITLPDFEEQQSIVHHIEIECTRLDLKIQATKKLIDLLTEYRTALISEVVTGKIKVI